ncbi:3724_t:CDS:2 [Paraglomus brasilianum]|uniref:3724_t:CDS:1 n=1 Tax=Paraglomus brasilianum TaxID=144538 RepID=A0A9N8VS97_9GLOM|nr:3724_t:CDS:2 [Paraglomus brasilianum]
MGRTLDLLLRRQAKCQAPPLAPEIIQEILSYLIILDPNCHDYHYSPRVYKDLYSCLLVNRLWCRSTVPLLWRQPLINNPYSRAKVLQVYYSCLDNHQKQQLQFQEPEIPFVDAPLPLFNYPSFLRFLDYDKLFRTMEALCKTMSRKCFHNMLNAILQLISNNTPKVNGFRFIVCRNNFWKPQDNEMLKADGITQMMKRLRTIDIGGDIGYERQKHLLEYLAEHCRMLESIRVGGGPLLRPKTLTQFSYSITTSTTYPEENVISNLILSQTNLQSFELRDIKWTGQSIRHALTAVISAVGTRKTSLRHLHFHSVNFDQCCSWQAISACENLESIELIDCSGITTDMVRPLIEGRLEKLKKVVITPEDKDREELTDDKKELWKWVDGVNGRSGDVRKTVKRSKGLLRWRLDRIGGEKEKGNQ